MPRHETLPIEALRGRFDHAIVTGPVVVSSPTGSGKSTRVPVWCLDQGRVLVVEPRRVACRSLAARVADVEGVQLGHAVGYRVRDDNRSTPKTRLLFATPGVALRMLAADGLADYAVAVVDEFHERSLDVDLLLALFRTRFTGRLVVMSATLDGDKVATFLGGQHLSAEGRCFPVVVYHRAGKTLLPEVRGVEARVVDALRAAANDPGDVLVFMPGKAEIASTAATVRGAKGLSDLEVVTLHGGLSLDEQSRAFAGAKRRKVVISTNVAETSVTIPGVGVVIDSGLVRRTRYHGGRGFLTLGPIALDSVEQRAGRAGRTAPGVCYRLWSPQARLEGSTPPEIYRESLVPLVLGAAACGANVERLEFLDAPKPHALTAALDELRALGALDADGGINVRGRALFGLPLDAPLARMLVEAEGTPVMSDVVDLVSVLATGRPLFAPGPRPEDEGDNLRAQGCDALAAIRALRRGRPHEHKLRAFTVEEARRISRRLRKVFGLPDRSPANAEVDRRALAMMLMAADPRVAHVARRRRRAVAWSNGGTELALGRECALTPTLETPAGEKNEAVLVLESRAIGVGRDRKLMVTSAMPVPLSWLRKAGLGRDRVVGASIKGQRVVARVERVHARRVLSVREEVPQGELAREALVGCFLRGQLWRKTLEATRDRLELQGLQASIDGTEGPAELSAWVASRVEALGVESGDDLALLSPDDLLADELPEYQRATLEREFPRQLKFGGMKYTVTYDLAKKEVTLERETKSTQPPPPLSWLPRFKGLRIIHRHKNVVRTLRARR